MRMLFLLFLSLGVYADNEIYIDQTGDNGAIDIEQLGSSNMIGCLLYTSPSPRDKRQSRMPSSA